MRIYLLGSHKNVKEFYELETILTEDGHSVINPLKVIDALPPIQQGFWIPVAQELIRISDVVYLIDGYEKDLIARLEKANADRLDKEFWNS